MAWELQFGPHGSWALRLTKNILRDNFVNAQDSAQVPESYKVLIINLVENVTV